MFALDTQYLQVEVGNVRDVDWIVKTPGQTSAGGEGQSKTSCQEIGDPHPLCVWDGGGGEICNNRSA